MLEAYFAGIDRAAVRQTRPDGTVETSAIEGSAAWRSGSTEDGGAMLRTIVLGHQFHALLLDFDRIVANARDGEITYAGVRRQTRTGDWPYGERGTATLVFGPSGNSVDALVFNFAGAPEIRVTFSDWRDVEGARLPFHMLIDDGANTYDYAFTAVHLEAATPSWAARP